MSLRYDRILREGDGPKTYGIEVCKSLQMPEEFLHDALRFRSLFTKGKDCESIAKKTNWNRSMVFDEVCALCDIPCYGKSEVHHIRERSESGSNYGNNLIVICTECHDNLHAKNIKLRKVATSKGGIATIYPSTGFRKGYWQRRE